MASDPWFVPSDFTSRLIEAVFGPDDDYDRRDKDAVFDAVLAVVQPELDRLMHIATLEREGNEIVEAERDEALAEVARVEALATKRDVLYPTKFGRTPSENYVMGYRAALADLRAALRTPDGAPDADAILYESKPLHGYSCDCGEPGCQTPYVTEEAPDAD